MSLFKVGRYFHYSFQYLGKRYHASTHLAATERNRNRAREMELKVKQTAREGNAHLLKLHPMGFSSAADQFIEWAKAEHRDKPNTWGRLAGSCTSSKEFFKQKPIHLVNEGDVEDYKTWRRTEHGVREVTLRHDLHCLGPLFRFAMKHRWCMNNPVERVGIPSDADAQVMNVISPAEERTYFASAEKISQDLYDVGRLIILQGPRPWCEVVRARVEHVNLAAGTWLIPKTKSNAGKRSLFLTPEAKSILARRIGTARDGNLFPARNGAQVRTLNKAHEKVLDTVNPCAECGRIKPEHRDKSCVYRRAETLAFRIYDVRHTFATRFYEATKDIAALAAILGHRDLKTVMRYVHISQDQQKRAMAVWSQQQELKIEAVN
jgi:site-specific recombinase XerD